MPPRFVILKHDHPFLHWDLLLEEKSTARTWRLLRKPCLSEPIAAQPLPPHRLLYLDYEGPVGNDRGYVERILAGTYEADSPSEEFVSLKFSENDFASIATIRTLSDGRVFITFAAAEHFCSPASTE